MLDEDWLIVHDVSLLFFFKRNSPPRYDKAEAHAPFHVHPDVTR